MLTPGNHRPPDRQKPASLANGKALRQLLREAGYELKLDANDHLVLDPPNAELQAGAQGWLKRYRVPLIEQLRIEALIADASRGDTTHEG